MPRLSRRSAANCQRRAAEARAEPLHCAHRNVDESAPRPTGRVTCARERTLKRRPTADDRSCPAELRVYTAAKPTGLPELLLE